MADEFMKINGQRRPVRLKRVDELLHYGFTNVDVNCPIKDLYAYQKLDLQGLESTMKQIGLVYSGVHAFNDFGPSWGFNDPSMMGVENVRYAQEQGSAYIWLRTTPRIDAAQVSITTFEFLMPPTELEFFGYSNGVLDTWVKFLENPRSYRQAKSLV